jgi:hypothetical protein
MLTEGKNVAGLMSRGKLFADYLRFKFVRVAPDVPNANSAEIILSRLDIKLLIKSIFFK